jgi:hypothetical protein
MWLSIIKLIQVSPVWEAFVGTVYCEIAGLRSDQGDKSSFVLIWETYLTKVTWIFLLKYLYKEN